MNQKSIDDMVFKETQDRLIHLYTLTKGKVPLSVVTLQYWGLVKMLHEQDHDSKKSYESVKRDVYKHLMGNYLRDYK